MYAETYNNITNLTRRESYLNRPINPRSKQILITLGRRTLTARQIAKEMGFSDLNAIKPRLTEMQSQGIVHAVGTEKDLLTGRTVAVWRIV